MHIAHTGQTYADIQCCNYGRQTKALPPGVRPNSVGATQRKELYFCARQHYML